MKFCVFLCYLFLFGKHLGMHISFIRSFSWVYSLIFLGELWYVTYNDSAFMWLTYFIRSPSLSRSNINFISSSKHQGICSQILISAVFWNIPYVYIMSGNKQRCSAYNMKQQSLPQLSLSYRIQQLFNLGRSHSIIFI